MSAGPGSVEEVFCQTFTAGVPGIGEVRMEPLIPGGEDIFVTEANRREYVDAYVDFYLNRSVQRQFEVLSRTPQPSIRGYNLCTPSRCLATAVEAASFCCSVRTQSLRLPPSSPCSYPTTSFAGCSSHPAIFAGLRARVPHAVHRAGATPVQRYGAGAAGVREPHPRLRGAAEVSAI